MWGFSVLVVGRIAANLLIHPQPALSIPLLTSMAHFFCSLFGEIIDMFLSILLQIPFPIQEGEIVF